MPESDGGPFVSGRLVCRVPSAGGRKSLLYGMPWGEAEYFLCRRYVGFGREDVAGPGRAVFGSDSGPFGLADHFPETVHGHLAAVADVENAPCGLRRFGGQKVRLDDIGNENEIPCLATVAVDDRNLLRAALVMKMEMTPE